MILNIVLSALDGELSAQWRRHCGDLPGVKLHDGSILDLEVDAVVSPANSFGFMDGGIDLEYTRRFGSKVQKRLQLLIREKHHGELLVGAAEIVPTDDGRIPFVIAAPTMRVPMILGETVNPHLAARAALLLAKRRASSGIRSIAFPGLGTGIGRVPAGVCARQMKAAIEEVVLGKGSFPASWDDAQEKHQLLYTSRVRDLQEVA